jgi:nicotinate phosphoribosyltransferase
MPEFALPDDHRPYTDKYFLHSRTILEGEGVNPHVVYQVFIRKGPGRIRGMDEALAILEKYGHLCEKGAQVWALPDGSHYEPGDTLMHIGARVQDVIELETMYLGVLTAATTRENDRSGPDIQAIREHASKIRDLCPDKKLIYFGSRHWHWNMDAEITKAIIEGGFDDASTDIGAQAAGVGRGVGTIPHALVITFGWKYGREEATWRATAGFDTHIDPDNPRIALIDTYNREIDDALETARRLEGRLNAVRIDTPGENVGQGADPEGEGYWGGTGVRISGALAMRRALDENGFEDVRIVLSSGFGKLNKLKAFVEAEKKHGRFFDALGIGGMYHSRDATADIVQVEGVDIGKTGRVMTYNNAMQRVI